MTMVLGLMTRAGSGDRQRCAACHAHSMRFVILSICHMSLGQFVALIRHVQLSLHCEACQRLEPHLAAVTCVLPAPNTSLWAVWLW